MITFECPHCGNRLEVLDAYAGRDGWCRVCKKMITVPTPDRSAGADLSPGEQHARMMRAFEYAATKADKYQVMFHKAHKENEQLVARLDELAGLETKLEAFEQRLAGLETDRPWRGGAETVDGGAASVVAASPLDSPEGARLSEQMNQEAGARQALDSIVQKMQAGQDGLRDQMQRLATTQGDLAEYNALAASAIDRLKADLEEERAGRFVLREDLEVLKSDLASVKEGLAVQFSLRENVQGLQSDLVSVKEGLAIQSALRENVQALESDLALVNEKFAAQSAQRENVQIPASDVASVKDALTAIGGIESDLASLKASVAAQGENVAAMSGRLVQLDALGERVHTIAGRLQDLSASIERFASMNAGVSEALAAAEMRDATRSSEWDRLIQGLALVRTEIEAVRTAGAAAEQRDRETQDRFATLQTSIEGIEQDAGAFRTELSRVAAALAEQPEPILEAPPDPDVSAVEDAGQEDVVVLSEVDDQTPVTDEKLLGTFLRFIGPSRPE